MLQAVEPVTHLLTGACLSRACGFPARVRYATAACVVAAELPDIDYVYRLGGPLLYFQHHRGWTHALWSLPLQAAVVTGCFFVLHNTRRRWKKHRSVEKPAPARWGTLWVLALLALCTHVFLDWTNNYGVRPFAPFYPKWFAGNIFFIVEPVLLVCLAAALLIPFIFSLAYRETGIRRIRYDGQRLALGAIAVMVLMLLVRGSQQTDARRLAEAQLVPGGVITYASASPYPAFSERWHGVIATPNEILTGTLHLKSDTFDIDGNANYRATPDTPYVTAAKGSWLGRIYLDWSPAPVVVDAGTAREVHPELRLAGDEAAAHVVRFADWRFRYGPGIMGGTSSTPPLGGEAWVGSDFGIRRIYFGSARQALDR